MIKTILTPIFNYKHRSLTPSLAHSLFASHASVGELIRILIIFLLNSLSRNDIRRPEKLLLVLFDDLEEVPHLNLCEPCPLTLGK